MTNCTKWPILFPLPISNRIADYLKLWIDSEPIKEARSKCRVSFTAQSNNRSERVVQFSSTLSFVWQEKKDICLAKKSCLHLLLLHSLMPGRPYLVDSKIQLVEKAASRRRNLSARYGFLQAYPKGSLTINFDEMLIALVVCVAFPDCSPLSGVSRYRSSFSIG